MPLPEQRFDAVRLEDRLLLKEADDLGVMALFMPGLEALRFGTRLLERHQRIAAQVQPLRRAAVPVAKLERDLSPRRDPNAETVAVAALFERRTRLAAVGLEPCVREAHTHPCVYIARERCGVERFMYAAMYINPPSRPVSPCHDLTTVNATLTSRKPRQRPRRVAA